MTNKQIALALSFAFPACTFDVPDLNRPAVDQILANPTPAAVASLATGLVAGERADIAQRIGYVSELGILGRESLVLSGSDDRFVTELLNQASLDRGTPNFGGNFWVTEYANLRDANYLLDALPKVVGLSDGDKAAVQGFAQTMMALDFLKLINTHDVNGAAIDVDLPLGQVAPIVKKDLVFARIAKLLDDGAGNLSKASAAFPFPLGNGFSSFSTPAQFLLVNRALAGRVAVYRGLYADALTALAASFLDRGASLTLGVYHSFGNLSGDAQNSLNTTDILVHPSIISDAEKQPDGVTLDNRVLTKTTPVTPVTLYGETSAYGFIMYPNTDTPVAIIRNEELILLRAEANIGLGNLTAAKDDIDFIRMNSGRLKPRCPSLGVGGCVSPAINASNILDELLKQKRYSLLFEGGHRWIDARRYGKLGTLPIDQPGQHVQPAFPIPLVECDARGGACSPQ
jgi:hypothetical protein